MKRRGWLALPVLLALAAPFAFAGHEGYKCTKSAQECLDMMAAGYKTHGWIGLELDKSDAGELKVKKVVPGSPAEGAGIREGDVLVAVNGVKYADENEEALKKAKKDMAPGKNATFTVSRNGKAKDITLTLAEMPREVIAQMVGQHMLDHAQVAQAQK